MPGLPGLIFLVITDCSIAPLNACLGNPGPFIKQTAIFVKFAMSKFRLTRTLGASICGRESFDGKRLTKLQLSGGAQLGSRRFPDRIAKALESSSMVSLSTKRAPSAMSCFSTPRTLRNWGADESTIEAFVA